MDLTQHQALSRLRLWPGYMRGGRARATASNTEALVALKGCSSLSVFAAVTLQQRVNLGMLLSCWCGRSGHFSEQHSTCARGCRMQRRPDLPFEPLYVDGAATC